MPKWFAIFEHSHKLLTISKKILTLRSKWNTKHVGVQMALVRSNCMALRVVSRSSVALLTSRFCGSKAQKSQVGLSSKTLNLMYGLFTYIWLSFMVNVGKIDHTWYIECLGMQVLFILRVFL